MRVLVMACLSEKRHREEYVTKKKEEIKGGIKRIWSDADITIIGRDDLERDNKIDTLKAISNVSWDRMFYYDYSSPYLHGLLDGIIDSDLWDHTTSYDEIQSIIEKINQL